MANQQILKPLFGGFLDLALLFLDLTRLDVLERPEALVDLLLDDLLDHLADLFPIEHLDLAKSLAFQITDGSNAGAALDDPAYVRMVGERGLGGFLKFSIHFKISKF